MSDTAAPLRRDVRLLGTILGDVLIEQEGAWLLELVERIRHATREARRDGSVASPELLSKLEPESQALVLRAFGLYFQLANLAEQHHRLRRRREDARDGSIARESLEDAFRQLAPVPHDELAERARGTSIELVLTAHPTETTRRTVLLAHIRIEAQLVQLDDVLLSPAERQAAERRIAEEVTLLWQTDEVRHDRLRVTDEIRHGLWFFEHSLMAAATDLVGEWRERLPGAPPPLRFGTWIGGDLDGNPSAGPPRSPRRSTAPGRWRSSSTAPRCGRWRSSSRRLGRSSRSLPSSMPR